MRGNVFTAKTDEKKPLELGPDECPKKYICKRFPESCEGRKQDITFNNPQTPNTCSRLRKYIRRQKNRVYVRRCKRCGGEIRTREYFQKICNKCKRPSTSKLKTERVQKCLGCGKEFSAEYGRQYYCVDCRRHPYSPDPSHIQEELVNKIFGQIKVTKVRGVAVRHYVAVPLRFWASFPARRIVEIIISKRTEQGEYKKFVDGLEKKFEKIVEEKVQPQRLLFKIVPYGIIILFSALGVFLFRFIEGMSKSMLIIFRIFFPFLFGLSVVLGMSAYFISDILINKRSPQYYLNSLLGKKKK